MPIKVKNDKLEKAKTAEEREAIEAEYAKLDRDQKTFAENCLLKQECGTSVLEKLNIPSYDAVMQACTPPHYCSAEEQRGVQELRNIYATAQNAIYPDTTIEEFLVANKIFGAVADSVKLAAGKIVSYGLDDAAKAANGAKGTVNAADVSTLTENGVKFTPENLVATSRTPSGQVVFLETGNSKAGLQHIVEQHGDDFARIGVNQSQIPSVIMNAVRNGKIVGYQGAVPGRPIYEVVVNGQPQRIAVTTGNNGFIVGANPTGGVK